jgi:hypothetical protein
MPHLFKEAAVAFLDILGFKQLIKNAETSAAGTDRLLALRTVLDSHVKFDNSKLHPDIPQEVQPKYLFVSDSIIFSVPLRHGKYDGLDIVVVKCVQVAQKVMELGHLVRGGISVGNVWHDHLNIFGTAYMGAYATEQSAVHPRVILSKEASNAWKQSTRAVPELCIDDGHHITVDTLNVAYLRTNLAGIAMEQYFEMLRVHVLTNLQNLSLGSEPRSKWEWMAGFFNDALHRHGLAVEPFSSIPVPD